MIYKKNTVIKMPHISLHSLKNRIGVLLLITILTPVGLLHEQQAFAAEKGASVEDDIVTLEPEQKDDEEPEKEAGKYNCQEEVITGSESEQVNDAEMLYVNETEEFTAVSIADGTAEKTDKSVDEDISEETQREIFDGDLSEEAQEEICDDELPEEVQEETCDDELTEEAQEETCDDELTEEMQEETRDDELSEELQEETRDDELSEELQKNIFNDMTEILYEDEEEMSAENSDLETGQEGVMPDEGTEQADLAAVRLMSNARLLSASASATHTLAIDSQDKGIVVMNEASPPSDSRYSFSLKAGADTRIDMWLDPEKSFAGAQSRIHTLWHEELMNIYDGYGIAPTDTSLSGKTGVWIWNAGTYQGQKVHAKLTFYFDNYTYTTQTGGKTYTIAPTFVVSARCDALIGIDLTDVGALIRYELYSGEEWTAQKDENGIIRGEPSGITRMTADMSLNFGDIDGVQDFGFRSNDGAIVSKQVYRNCEVFYREQVPGYEDFIWMYAGDTDIQQEPNTLGEVRLEMEAVSSFDIIYAGWTRFAFSDVPDYRYGPGEHKHITSMVQCYNRYQTACSQIQNGCFNPHGFADGSQRALLTYFTSYAFTPYDVPDPVKTVSDEDETGVYENTLSPEELTYFYSIRQTVPLERPDYYYSSFEIRDPLPAGISISEVSVCADDGTEVTDSFRFSLENTQDGSGTELVIQALPDLLKSSAFYNRTYHFLLKADLLADQIKQTLSQAHNASVSESQVQNTAYTNVTRNETVEGAVSNTVITNICWNTSLIRPVLRITKRTDRKREEGRTAFLFRICGDNGLIYTMILTIPPGELEASGEISLEALPEGTTYTVTEVETARYGISSVYSTSENAVCYPSDGSAESTLHSIYDTSSGTGTPAVPERVELIFENRLLHEELLGWSDWCINAVSCENSE